MIQKSISVLEAIFWSSWKDDKFVTLVYKDSVIALAEKKSYYTHATSLVPDPHRSTAVAIFKDKGQYGLSEHSLQHYCTICILTLKSFNTRYCCYFTISNDERKILTSIDSTLVELKRQKLRKGLFKIVRHGWKMIRKPQRKCVWFARNPWQWLMLYKVRRHHENETLAQSESESLKEQQRSPHWPKQLSSLSCKGKSFLGRWLN